MVVYGTVATALVAGIVSCSETPASVRCGVRSQPTEVSGRKILGHDNIANERRQVTKRGDF